MAQLGRSLPSDHQGPGGGGERSHPLIPTEAVDKRQFEPWRAKLVPFTHLDQMHLKPLASVAERIKYFFIVFWVKMIFNGFYGMILMLFQ